MDPAALKAFKVPDNAVWGGVSGFSQSTLGKGFFPLSGSLLNFVRHGKQKSQTWQIPAVELHSQEVNSRQNLPPIGNESRIVLP